MTSSAGTTTAPAASRSTPGPGSSKGTAAWASSGTRPRSSATSSSNAITCAPRRETNSGIFVRVPDVPSSHDYIYHSIEIQINDAGEDIHATGAAYDIKASAPGASLPPGQWNHIKIAFRGARLAVEINGKVVLDWDAVPGGKVRDLAAEGYIGFQNHDSDSAIRFKDIYIKEL